VGIRRRASAHRPPARSAIWGIAIAAFAAGCGSGSVSPSAASPASTSAVVTSDAVTTSATMPIVDPAPRPEEMCPVGEHPMVAAYALADGAFRWAACTTDTDMYLVKVASEETVWVERPGAVTATIALAAADGAQVDEPVSNAPQDADRATSHPPASGAIQVHGGQDDPLWASDDATGATVWSAWGHPYYDDVWASGDGALFIDAWDPSGATPGGWLAAYEITTGEERWRWVPDDGYGSPWHATDDWVFVLGTDVWVLDTADGSVHWRTDYGDRASEYPRLFGALANSDTVFVSFTMIPSDGD